MCLWLFNSIRDQGCMPVLNCVSPLACFALAPVGGLVGLVWALSLGIAKLFPGVFRRTQGCCECYCAVIQGGQRAYDVEAGRAVDEHQQRQDQERAAAPTSAVDSLFNSYRRDASRRGSQCMAEVYCCCIPGFVVLVVFASVLMILELILCSPVRGLCAGANSACGTCGEWPQRMGEAFDDIDMQTSLTAFGTTERWFPPPAKKQGQQLNAPTTTYGAGVPPVVQHQPAGGAVPEAAVEGAEPPAQHNAKEPPSQPVAYAY